MIAWGPDFADYAIAVCCMGWLAPAVYQAVRDVRALVRYLLRRKRQGLRPLRVVGAPYGGPPTVAGGSP